MKKNLSDKPIQWISAFISAMTLAGCQTTHAPTVMRSADNKTVAVQVSLDKQSLLWDQSLGTDVANKSKKIDASGSTDLNAIQFKGEAALLERNTRAANANAKRMLNHDVRNGAALKIQIKAALIDQKPRTALLLCDNALDSSPQDADLISLKGLAYSQLGQLIIAKAMWNQALRLDPLNIPTLMNLGVLLFNHGHTQRAGAHFDKVLALVPRHKDALLGKALVYSAQGDAQRAVRLLEDVRTNTSESPLVLTNLANIAREHLKDYGLALNYVEKILALKRSDRKSLETAVTLKQDLKRRMAAQKVELSDESLREMAELSAQSAPSVSEHALNQGAIGEENELNRLEESIK